MKAFQYAVAETRGAALAAVADGWVPKAGGVDLLDHLKERIGHTPRIVGLHEIGELRGAVEEPGGAIRIGPLTTLRELSQDATIRRALPSLAEAAGHAATPQIRALATVGGNLCQRPRCWYYRQQAYHCLKKGGGTCYAVEGENQFHALFGGGPCHIVHPSNLAPVLVAANAQFELTSPAGARVVPAREFFVLPSESLGAENVLEADELMTAIRIPMAPRKSGYVELRHRQSFDWPLATCAVTLMPEGPVGDGAQTTASEASPEGSDQGGWCVVMGAVAPVPWRSAPAEVVLAGHESITAELAERAADAALEGAEPMSQNAWRLRLARAAVRRALLAAEGLEDA